MSLTAKLQTQNSSRLDNFGTVSLSSNKSTKKGISLAKSLKEKKVQMKSRSPSFIKMTSRTNKEVFVERREIKLIVKEK